MRVCVCCVCEGEVSERFEVQTGMRQGCVLSPILFNCYMDNIMREASESLGGGINISYNTSKGLYLTYRDAVEGSTTFQEVLYADDLALVAEQRQDLQGMLLVVDMVCKKWGMAISVEKSKVLAVGGWRSDGTHLFEQPNPRRGGVLHVPWQ